MNERNDPDVLAYLEAENRYTAQALSGTRELRARLLDEMRGRIVPDDSSAPYRENGYWYYDRFEAACEYPLYCRRQDRADADEQVMLDVNQLADGHSYFSLRGFTVSPDGKRAAYAVDTVGNRVYTIGFLDLSSGEMLDDLIPAVTANLEWAADSRTILYARQDPDTLRHYQVLRYRLGDGASELVYQEEDERCWLSVERSLSGRFFYLLSEATLSTEVRFLPRRTPSAAPALFLRREDGHEYFVTDGADRFFVLSNAGAENFRVFECPLDDTRRSAWRGLVAHRPDVLIDGMDVFARHVVLGVVENGLDQIEILDRRSGALSRIDFDEAAYTVGAGDNYDYEASALRLEFESPVTPETIIDVEFASGRQSIVKRQRVPGGFRSDDYVSERRFAEVRDGTRVPVTLVYRQGLRRDGRAPLLIYAYGAYGISTEPDFDGDLFSLLDRGFVYAIAHVRGGSELGRPWYYAGRRRDKMNTFLDFIDVTRYLHSEAYSSAGRTYAMGGSAGGLLVGAVANMAPGLYRGMCARVPFVDVVTTMLDESLPLTTGEFDEWGNPADRDAYFYMLGYSPYDNVRAQAYPHLLVTAGLHDSQVQYWEPAKWVARLRELRTGDSLVLLETDLEAGHGGKSGRYKSLRDTATVYAFFLMLAGDDFADGAADDLAASPPERER